MKSVFIFCFVLLLASCSGDNDYPTTCGVLFPTKQLPWLMDIIKEYNKADFMDITIEQGEYNSQTVFIITPCCTTCDLYMITPVYTCDGIQLEGVFPYDEIKDRKVIWKTPADKAECW